MIQEAREKLILIRMLPKPNHPNLRYQNPYLYFIHCLLLLSYLALYYCSQRRTKGFLSIPSSLPVPVRILLSSHQVMEPLQSPPFCSPTLTQAHLPRRVILAFPPPPSQIIHPPVCPYVPQSDRATIIRRRRPAATKKKLTILPSWHRLGQSRKQSRRSMAQDRRVRSRTKF
jgi:hypothetical protein